MDFRTGLTHLDHDLAGFGGRDTAAVEQAGAKNREPEAELTVKQTGGRGHGGSGEGMGMRRVGISFFADGLGDGLRELGSETALGSSAISWRPSI